MLLLAGCGCRNEGGEKRGDKPPPPLPNRLVHVLCYHHLTANPKSDSISVKPDDFRAQMQALKDGGYSSLSCAQLADYFANTKDIPDKSVIISFDDGRLSFQEVAAPILDEFGFKAVLFINPGMVGGKGFLSWDQLKALQQAGHEIDSHTLTHENLTKNTQKLTLEKFRELIRDQITDSYRQIEEHIGVAPVGLAYPFGNYDEHVIRTTGEAGHRLAFSIDPGGIDSKSNHWNLPRKMVVNGTSMRTFERNLSTEPLHLVNVDPPVGQRLTSRQYTFTAQVLDADAAGQVNAEGGRGAKVKYDEATQQITVTSRLNRGANLVRLFSTGTPRRESAWIVVVDASD
jgi:peptidoglycan/xylan/chitin deacetylase (PgdA/CDA1 family)